MKSWWLHIYYLIRVSHHNQEYITLIINCGQHYAGGRSGNEQAADAIAITECRIRPTALTHKYISDGRCTPIECDAQ